MNCYEHTFIAKQDLAESQNKKLVDKYHDIINKNSGKVLKTEEWGLRNLVYEIKNNNKGFLNIINPLKTGQGRTGNGLAFYFFRLFLDKDFRVHPRPRHRRLHLGDAFVGRAVLVVGAGQIADAHQEFVDDFPAHELEGLAEKLRPFGPVPWMVGGDPFGKATVAVTQRHHPARVVDDGIDLEPVADDPGVLQQPPDIPFAVGGHRVDVEVVEGLDGGRAFLEHDLPRQPGLEQFQGL